MNSMRKRFAQRRLLALGLAAIAAAAVAGGIAWATIPDQNGVIHGCYLKAGGTLRVIDPSVANCKRTETAIAWNEQGPQGPPGEPGGGAAVFAGYADFHSGAGGAGSILLPGPDDPAVRITTLSLPAGWATDDAGAWRPGVNGLVTTATVQFVNQGPVMAHPGCTVMSDSGGFGDGHTYVSGTDMAGQSPTTVSISFQSARSAANSMPPTEIWLECRLGSDHPPLPPGGEMNVQVLNASLSVVPRSF